MQLKLTFKTTINAINVTSGKSEFNVTFSFKLNKQQQFFKPIHVNFVVVLNCLQHDYPLTMLNIHYYTLFLPIFKWVLYYKLVKFNYTLLL